MSKTRLSNEEIRLWILSDESLYLWAREGHHSDDAMYKHLAKFIRTNRAELVRRINARS